MYICMYVHFILYFLPVEICLELCHLRTEHFLNGKLFPCHCDLFTKKRSKTINTYSFIVRRFKNFGLKSKSLC